MSNKRSHKNNSRKFDTAFINPCIDRVLEATEQLINGSKVLLVFENPLNRTDNFQLTELFPLHIYDFPRTIKTNKLWKKLFLLCPHLVQPQKVIYSHSKKVRTIARLADILFKNQFNTKSVFIDRKRPDNFSFLKTDHLKGVIYQEYKVNVSRIFIEILKYFELNGGKILFKAYHPEEITTVIQCHSINRQSYLLSVEVPSNFAFVKSYKKDIFRFTEKKNNLQVDPINASSDKLSKEEILHRTQKIISFESNSMKEIELISFLSIQSLKNILKVIDKTLPGSFENAQIKDNYELSLEKFDLAKQTGITYPEFKILYHRYGAGIDKMIDVAYEKMDKTRDPQKIWEMAEKEFQMEYEWRPRT
jgi:hypothetical protein